MSKVVRTIINEIKWNKEIKNSPANPSATNKKNFWPKIKVAYNFIIFQDSKSVLNHNCLKFYLEFEYLACN